MLKLIRALMLLFMFFLLVGGCSLSEEEAVGEALDNAEKVFYDEEKIDANKQIDTFSFYLPERMEIAEADANNVVLKDGDNKYIIFYNRLEQSTSELLYEEAADDKAILYEALEDNSKFGYIRALPDSSEDTYELQVGIGGVKITTQSTKRQLADDAETLMTIARSIIETEQN